MHIDPIALSLTDYINKARKEYERDVVNRELEVMRRDAQGIVDSIDMFKDKQSCGTYNDHPLFGEVVLKDAPTPEWKKMRFIQAQLRSLYNECAQLLSIYKTGKNGEPTLEVK